MTKLERSFSKTLAFRRRWHSLSGAMSRSEKLKTGNQSNVESNLRLKGIWSSNTRTTMTSSQRQAKVLASHKNWISVSQAISRHADPPRRADDSAGGGGFREFVKLFRHSGDEDLGREGQRRLRGADQQWQIQEPYPECSGGEDSVTRSRITCVWKWKQINPSWFWALIQIL